MTSKHNSTSSSTKPFVIPDFNELRTGDRLPIEDLRAFIRDPFRPLLSFNFISQMEAAICIIVVLLLMATAVIWRRVEEKSFWLFRKDERKNGVLVVPNAVTTFVLIQFVFGTVWVGYAIQQILVSRDDASPAGLMLWLGLTWLPLIQGAWFAGWGTFFASPLQARRSAVDYHRTASSRFRNLVLSTWHRFERLRASMLNSIVVVVPLAHMIVIITLTALAECQWIPAVKHWQTFDQTLVDLIQAANESSSPSILGSVTAPLNDTARAVWHDADDAFQALEAVWWAWAGSAFAFTILYSIFGGTMLYQLMREVKTLRSRRDAQKQSKVPPSPKGGPSDDDVAGVDVVLERAPVAQGESTLQTSFWPPILDHSTNPNQQDALGQGSKGSRQSKRTRRTARYATMRKVTLLVGVQIVSISVAALGFSILALVLATTVRRAVQHHEFARVYTIANELAAWIACLFGGVIFVAITARTFEYLTDVAIAAARNRSWSNGDADGGENPTTSRDTMRHRASQALVACLHPDQTQGNKTHANHSGAVYSRNHVRYADPAAGAGPAPATQGRRRLPLTEYQYDASDSLTRAGSSRGLRAPSEGPRRSGSNGKAAGDKRGKGTGFYSIQTIFQDDTIAPIDEEQSSELREMNVDTRYQRPKPEALARPNAGDTRSNKTGFSATVWNSMASRFTPLKTSERRAQIDDAFEDDTITPLDESPNTTVDLHDLLARQQVGDLVRSYARGNDSQERYRRYPPNGRVDSIESPQASLWGSSQNHNSGDTPNSDAILRSPGAAKLQPRRPIPSQEKWRTQSFFTPMARGANMSPLLRTAASSPSFNLPTLPPHSMPPAARELVREAIENIPSGPRSPSRLSRNNSYQTHRSGKGDATRQQRLKTPPTTASSAHSRGGMFWASSSSDIGLAREREKGQNGSEEAFSAVTTPLQTSPLVTAAAAVLARSASAPTTAKGAAEISPVSPSTEGGRTEESGALWIDGHRIEPGESGGKD